MLIFYYKKSVESLTIKENYSIILHSLRVVIITTEQDNNCCVVLFLFPIRFHRINRHYDKLKKAMKCNYTESDKKESNMVLKDKILEELIQNSDTYISGQILAEKFGVSRNAVWKSIKQIKEEGCKIHSINNKGYRLISCNESLSVDRISTHMSELSRTLDLSVIPSIDSTNNEAKRMIANGYRGNALIVANEQTNGRGRRGRSFYSPKNTGIYMSFVFSTDAKFSKAVSLTTISAVAVVKAIESITNLKPMIKWVNDVYLGGKKICGILTEAVTDVETGLVQSIVIGIGINISTEHFPDDISQTASSININGLSRNKLTAAISNELMEICSDLNNKAYIRTYKEHSLLIGKSIDFYKNNVKYNATAVDIDNEGGLVVKLPNGKTEILNSGEITVRLA